MKIKGAILILIALLPFSCGEKLMQKPENLIPKDKMVVILSDMAVANSAKSTNIGLIRDNNIDPTRHVLKKHGVDSTRFVESDRYYASLPAEYAAIYTEVELRLTKQKKELEEAKMVSDSLRRIELKSKQMLKDSSLQELKDSLP